MAQPFIKTDAKAFAIYVSLPVDDMRFYPAVLIGKSRIVANIGHSRPVRTIREFDTYNRKKVPRSQ